MAYVQTRESINVQTILLPEPRRFVNNHRLPPVASESGRQNLKEKKKKRSSSRANGVKAREIWAVVSDSTVM